MAEVQISDIALELGYDSKEIIEKAQEMGLKVKASNSKVSVDDAEDIYNYIQTGELPVKKKATSSKKVSAKHDTKEVAVKSKTTDKLQEKNKEDIKPQTKSEIKKVDDVQIKEIKPIEEVKEQSVKEVKQEPKKEIFTDNKIEPKKDELKVEKASKNISKEEDIKKDELNKELVDKEKVALDVENKVKKIDQESIASSLGKRRGIVILKKKKDDEKPLVESKKPAVKLNLGLDTLFSNAESSLKKKKEKKVNISASKR
ncbi:MAG: translation initiation factor IF-2, partial [Campylobacter sp.]|nr:translation initiation factor IF-2 [Campylobacter sp.]